MRFIQSFTYRDVEGDKSIRTVMRLDLVGNLLHAIDLSELTEEDTKEVIRAVRENDETPGEFYDNFVKEFNSRTKSYRTFRTDRIS